MFARLIQEALKKWNERELAEKLDVSLPTIRRWSTGASHPHPRIQSLIEFWIFQHEEEKDHVMNDQRMC